MKTRSGKKETTREQTSGSFFNKEKSRSDTAETGTPFFQPPAIQAKCAACEAAGSDKEEQEGTVQKKENGQSGSMAAAGIENSLNAAKGKGAVLPEESLSNMETAFGQDFSNVKIHTNDDAIAMNEDLNAQAFTQGNDIFFNSGKFSPGSKDGQRLLAHELTHVVQQRSATTPGQVQRVTDPIPETNNQFYGHGAFMGAAPQLMADPKWNRILQVLMPDVHADVTKALSKGPNSEEIILMMENNPVMAAYGMYQTRQMDVRGDNGRSDRISKMQAIEWDVFLPTDIVAAFKKAPTEEEKRKLAHDMVEEMIIAHGTGRQTAKENASLWGVDISSRQYDNVRKNRKTDMGGVRPGAWMDMFGRALTLATDPDWERIAREYEDPTLNPRVNNPKEQSSDQTFENKLKFQTVITQYKTIFGKETFNVLLDIKSRDATPEVLKALVTDLNLRGVLVYGVGTFKHSEIEGLSTMNQTVDGRVYSGPRGIKFYHYAGNLQEDCLANKVKFGDTVMFNAGSLLDYDKARFGEGKKKSYRVNHETVRQLKIYKDHYGFQLGLYVQENDIDDRAATLINDLANSRPDIFDLGFAWGGLSGETASDIEPSLFGGPRLGRGAQDSVFVPSTMWDPKKPLPGTAPSSAGPGFSSTISIHHNFLQSRYFDVNSGNVSVTCDADWSDPSCVPATYYMTLAKQISFWPNSKHGTQGFPPGRSFTAHWAGLEPGTYYLEIWVNDHNPYCELNGNINVST